MAFIPKGSSFLFLLKKKLKKCIQITWKDKISKERKDLDLDSVACIDGWEINTLKEARPDWIDPDDDEAFFEKNGISEFAKNKDAVKKTGKK